MNFLLESWEIYINVMPNRWELCKGSSQGLPLGYVHKIWIYHHQHLGRLFVIICEATLQIQNEYFAGYM